ncbi:MAG: hypothetical protein AAB570_04590 [Patescibacteria group bacterium]
MTHTSLVRAIDPAHWPHTQQAQESINQPGNGSGHEVIQFGVAQHPEKPVCYFATKSAVYLPPPANTGDLFTAIYAYNIDDGTWERIFKRQTEYDAEKTQESALETYYVLGYDDGRLIVQILKKEAPEDNNQLWDIPFVEGESSGPVAIDIEQPYAKRPPYEPR